MATEIFKTNPQQAYINITDKMYKLADVIAVKSQKNAPSARDAILNENKICHKTNKKKYANCLATKNYENKLMI